MNFLNFNSGSTFISFEVIDEKKMNSFVFIEQTFYSQVIIDLFNMSSINYKLPVYMDWLF